VVRWRKRLFDALGALGQTMRSLATALVTMVLFGSAINVLGAPLSVFQYEELAQRHCPTDTVVWVDFKKRVYYVKGQRLYARGNTGAFVCRQEARRNGNRRSLLGR
jgi:hypothetical protein